MGCCPGIALTRCIRRWVFVNHIAGGRRVGSRFCLMGSIGILRIGSARGSSRRYRREQPDSIAVADFDQDGNPDLAVASTWVRLSSDGWNS
jgi:hypothetical protein